MIRLHLKDKQFFTKLRWKSRYIAPVLNIGMSLDLWLPWRILFGDGLQWNGLREVTFLIRLVCPVSVEGLIILDPDVGVDDDIAQFYFMQLISAMVYCSSPRR